ncbi:MAG: alpha/beta hydrolase [Jaaginema sp. PMC 1078.18]|nr:alpha/beta hydrolase [Jaaginema sp. PMC 1078.18]
MGLSWQQGSILCLFTLGMLTGLTQSAIAAQNLTLKLGTFEQTLSLQDLEHFAATGELKPSLQIYQWVLTPQVRALLARQTKVDASVADTLLDELLAKSDGRQLLQQLQGILPESSDEQIKTALYRTLEQNQNVSILSFAKAYPQDTLTLDITAAIATTAQLQVSQWQSRLLSPILARELQVDPPNEIAYPPNLDPTQAGKYRVRQRSLTLIDRERQRRIPVDLFYAPQTQGPLIVLSHGFAADRRFLNYLAEHLASHGFSVAAIEHPGSSIDTLAQISLNLNPTQFLPPSEFIDRPKDISFLLDELERINDGWGYLSHKFNTDNTIAIGHSLGGYTVLALAGGELDLKELRQFCQDRIPLGRAPADWLQCAAAQLPQTHLRLRDVRIKRAIALNPSLGHLFGDRGLEQVRTPTVILTSSEDSITPPLQHQLEPFKQLTREKYLVSVTGGTHMSVTDLANQHSMVGRNTLVREKMGYDTEPVRDLAKAVSLTFAYQETPYADLYAPFLSAAYVQSLSTPNFPMRLTQKLPSTTQAWLRVLEFGEQRFAYRGLSQGSEKLPIHAKTTNRCFFYTEYQLPGRKRCMGQLQHIFTNLLSNDPV